MRRQWVFPVAIAVGCCSATLCVRWSGGDALDRLSFEGALSTLRDRSAPKHHRRAAAAVLMIQMRIAVRDLQADHDLQAHVGLLLQQLADMIRAPR